VAWWQGNLGYRRAQIRLTQGFKLAENWGLKLEAGATRTIADKLTGTPDTDPGADAEYPTAQSRVSLSFPVGGKRQGTFGVSGHYGIEERHESTTVTDREVVSWSVDADLRLPLAPWLLLQAEGFVGQDLSAYLGGIGQGYDATRREAVAALGGWTAVSLGPWGDWQFNLGAGIDKVDKDDVTANVDPAKDPRISNVVYFGNVYYTLTTNLQLALEISYLRTAYKSAALGDDWREQFSVIYKF
jgi:hypothetical protein